MRKAIRILATTCVLLFGLTLIGTSIAASIWNLSWRTGPPDYFVQITPVEIDTAGHELHYLGLGLVLLWLSLFVLIGIFSVTRPRIRPWLCRKCSYDLTGNISGICPECGKPTMRAPGVDFPPGFRITQGRG